MKFFDNDAKLSNSSIVFFNESNEFDGNGKKIDVSVLDKKVEEICSTKKIWSPEYNFSLEDYVNELKNQPQKPKVNNGKVLLLRSFKMGDEPALGKKLLLGFFSNLLNYNEVPAKIIVVGTAYSLTTGVGEGSDPRFIDMFKKLEEKGCEIVTCITCVDHFGVSDQLKVGRLGNAKENVDLFMTRDVVTLT